MNIPSKSFRQLASVACLLGLCGTLPAWADHGGGGGHGGGGHMGGGGGRGFGGGQYHGFAGNNGHYWGGGYGGYGGYRGGWGGGWGGRPWYRGDWGWGGWGWGGWGFGMGLGTAWALSDPWLYNPYPWGAGYYGYGAASPTVVVNQAPVSPQGTTYLGSTQQAGPPQSWFYCESAKGYYPYVPQCPEPWRAVPATPPGAISQ